MSESTSASVERDLEHAGRGMRFFIWVLQPKIGIPLFILFVLLLAPFMNRARKLARVPEAPAPFDVAAFKADLVPDDQNAALKMIVAAKALVRCPTSEVDNYNKALAHGWSGASPGIREWVRANQPALVLWREAAHMPDAQYIKPGTIRIDTVFPMVQEARELTRILTLEAGRLRSEGQLAEASELLVDGIRAGELIGKRGCLIEYLSSAAIVATVRDELLALAADEGITPELLKGTLSNLQQTFPRDPSVVHAIKVEYLWMQDLPSTHSLAELVTAGMCKPGFATQLSSLLYFEGEPQITSRAAGHVHARLIDQLAKRRCERTKRSGAHSIFDSDASGAGTKWSGTEISNFINESRFAKTLIWPVENIIDSHDRSVVAHDLLRVGLALEWFRRVKGHYSERLEELVPEYLPELPDDAFAPTKMPLSYRCDAATAKLWSTGTNGVDDGGAYSWPRKELDLDYGIFLPPKRPTSKQDEADDHSE